jgi:integrase
MGKKEFSWGIGYQPAPGGAVLTASPYRGEGRSYVDLDRGIFYRLAEGSHATNKRQPPVPLPRRLLAHLRRWASKGIVNEYFVEWNGLPVKSVKTAFKTAVCLAKVTGRISPHTLRHTAATWLMQNGVDKWEAAGFLGISVEMLDRVYGHHHPDHLRVAAHALGYRRSLSLAITLAPSRRPRSRERQPAGNIGGPGRTRTSNQTVMSGRL